MNPIPNGPALRLARTLFVGTVCVLASGCYAGGSVRYASSSFSPVDYLGTVAVGKTRYPWDRETERMLSGEIEFGGAFDIDSGDGAGPRIDDLSSYTFAFGGRIIPPKWRYELKWIAPYISAGAEFQINNLSDAGKSGEGSTNYGRLGGYVRAGTYIGRTVLLEVRYIFGIHHMTGQEVTTDGVSLALYADVTTAWREIQRSRRAHGAE